MKLQEHRKRYEIPADDEIWNFMVRECKPFNFRYESGKRMSIDLKEREIKVDKDWLREDIKLYISWGLDWKEVVRSTIKHEKRHIYYYRLMEHWMWEFKIDISAYGKLPIAVVDAVINGIDLRDDASFQKCYRMRAQKIYEEMKKGRWLNVPPPELYNRAALEVALGYYTLEDAVSLFPSGRDYITEIVGVLKELLKTREKVHEAADRAFHEARRIYLAKIGESEEHYYLRAEENPRTSHC